MITIILISIIIIIKITIYMCIYKCLYIMGQVTDQVQRKTCANANVNCTHTHKCLAPDHHLAVSPPPLTIALCPSGKRTNAIAVHRNSQLFSVPCNTILCHWRRACLPLQQRVVAEHRAEAASCCCAAARTPRPLASLLLCARRRTRP